jgi:hypothetical protein
VGPAGATGATGAAGKAGEIQLVTCKTVTVSKNGKRVKQQKCTTKTITGTASFTTASAHATLERGSVAYATGMAHAGRVTLHAGRAIRRGRYTLILTPRSDTYAGVGPSR